MNPTETVKITVNGKEIEAPKGANLLKTLIDNKMAVPHYCYHPGLSIAGACRMCFVEIEGQAKPLISCNAQVTENMVVKTETDKLKEIQKWNLAFHLINHPLDCPICDQAGECGLQDYYMKYGKYESDMHENKVTKRKVISIGEQVMLDTERCILCSRCVRFFDEVPKTGEMAIFNRGDRSEIGTYLDKDLKNNYTLNSVDICPVGALTSKDFRFKKRVWFLKEFNSVCPGCSTGCNVTVSEDPKEKRTFRMKPRYNAQVNGYWMCDYGRMRYKFANPENRIQMAALKRNNELVPIEWTQAKKEFTKVIHLSSSETVVLITPQYTNEEYEKIYTFFTQSIRTQNIFHCVDTKKAADPSVTDELLMRPDKNPNSNGLLAASRTFNLEKNNFFVFKESLKSKKWPALIVFSPEDTDAYPEWLKELEEASESVSKKILIGTQNAFATPFFDIILPSLSFVEKTGTFINFQGLHQMISAGEKLVDEAKSVEEILC